jgi:hypothetical protein
MENLGSTHVDGHFDERYWADVEADQASQRQLGQHIDDSETAAHAEAAARAANQDSGIVIHNNPL